MRRRNLPGRAPFKPPSDRAAERAEDFGIERDHSYCVSVPSANDVHAKLTITLPYVRWLGRVKVPAHENH